MRDYFDNDNRRFRVTLGPQDFVHVPTGIAVFANNFVEEGTPPREWAERLYNVRWWTPMPRGGHFAAVEEPALLAPRYRGVLRRVMSLSRSKMGRQGMLHEVRSDFTRVDALAQSADREVRVWEQRGVARLDGQPIDERESSFERVAIVAPARLIVQRGGEPRADGDALQVRAVV